MRINSIGLACIFAIILNLSSIAQKYDAIVLSKTASYEVEVSSILIKESLTIQINNKTGDDYAVFAIPYSKDLKISQLKAWIVDGSGNIVRELKKNEIIERNEYSNDLYTDRFLKMFQMKHTSYPYKIVCEYTYTRKNYMHICDWSPVAYKNIPTLEATLRVNIPLEMNFRTYTREMPQYRLDTLESRVVLELSSAYPTPVKSEIYSIGNRQIPMVSIVPLEFTNENNGSWKTWQEYGDWVYGLIDGKDVLPESEQAIVTNLLKGVTDKREIVRRLYHYMQDHTRYINVSIGIGALKPYPAEYVCSNKYGDCKALTNYMKALLRYAGIDSFYSLIELDEFPDDFMTDFPSHQFNHIVLMVPMGNDTIWLENTSNINPMGYMGSNTQNRYSLIISPGKSRLLKVPALSGNQVLEKKMMVFDLSKTEMTRVTIHNNYGGRDFEQFNSLNSQLNDNDKDRIIRQIMMFDNYEVNNWEIIKHNRDTARIDLNVNLSLNKFLNPMGNDLYFTLNPTGIPAFTNTANRTLPAFIPYPINIVDTLVYYLPENYALKNQSEPVSIRSDYGNYEHTVTASDGKVTVIKRFELYRGDYNIDQYPEFYQFIELARKADKSKIVIKQL